MNFLAKTLPPIEIENVESEMILTTLWPRFTNQVHPQCEECPEAAALEWMLGGEAYCMEHLFSKVFYFPGLLYGDIMFQVVGLEKVADSC